MSYFVEIQDRYMDWFEVIPTGEYVILPDGKFKIRFYKEVTYRKWFKTKTRKVYYWAGESSIRTPQRFFCSKEAKR